MYKIELESHPNPACKPECDCKEEAEEGGWHWSLRRWDSGWKEEASGWASDMDYACRSAKAHIRRVAEDMFREIAERVRARYPAEELRFLPEVSEPFPFPAETGSIWWAVIQRGEKHTRVAWGPVCGFKIEEETEEVGVSVIHCPTIEKALAAVYRRLD